MKYRLRSMTIVALMSSVICILGPMVLPIGVVPISFTTIGLYLTAMILKPAMAAASVILYLLIGFAGMPVFSGFTMGPGILFGPTGGYLIAYIPAVWICSCLLKGGPVTEGRKRGPAAFLHCFAVLVLGNIILYAVGTLWLSVVLPCPPVEAAKIGVLPFVIPDLAKILVVIFLSEKIRKALRRVEM